MALTAKQARFVEEYLIDLNATQAAIRAGYSKKTADKQGSQLLGKPSIAEAIAAARAKRSKRTEITQDRVLAELAKVGFSDIRKLLTPTGNLIGPNEWDDDTAGAVASIEIVTRPGGVDESGEREVEHVAKIRTWDKLSALDKLAKHVGLYDEGLSVTVNVPFDGWQIERAKSNQTDTD